MSKHRTNKEKKARRAAKAAAEMALPPEKVKKQRQLVPPDLRPITQEVDIDEPLDVLHNMAYPDDPVDVGYAVNPPVLAPGSLEVLAQQLRIPPKKRDLSIRDSIILENMNRFVPAEKVAKLPTVNMSPIEVRRRYMELLKDENTYSSAEMKLLVTQQLKNIVNMVYSLAEQGSVEHLKIMGSMLEQLQKTYSLWDKKSAEAEELFTVRQTKQLVDMAFEMGRSFRDHIERALEGVSVPPQVIDAAIQDAMTVSASQIKAAMEETIEV